MYILNNKKCQSGFTLIETLVATAVFLVIAVSAYQGYVTLLKGAQLVRLKSTAVELAHEQFEIMRALPFVDVGTEGGIPSGRISPEQIIVRDGITFSVKTTIRTSALPSDVQIGSTTSDAVLRNATLAEVSVHCTQCSFTTPIVMTAMIAPHDVEANSNNGSLLIKVIDANGEPITGASVHVVNTHRTPPISIQDSTDAQGVLRITDIPADNDSYKVTVTKAGYSTDETYTLLSVIKGKTTHKTFSIDKLGSIQVFAQDAACLPLGSISYHIRGDKTVSQNPNVYKYEADATTGQNGTTMNGMEWGNYTFSLNGLAYDIAGINPPPPLFLGPGAQAKITMTVVPRQEKSLLVVVQDAVTGLPLSDAEVTLQSEDATFISTRTTDQGVISQSNWSGNAYESSDGNVETELNAGLVSLKKIFTTYASSGSLISSTFDTGTSSTFGMITWLPRSQNRAVGTDAVRFQIASATSSAPTSWDFKGPDGTSATFYTEANQIINSVHSGDQFVKYKLFLSTASSTVTPLISDVVLTFNHSCNSPGQVFYQGLVTGTYTLSVSKNGYKTVSLPVTISSPWNIQNVILQR